MLASKLLQPLHPGPPFHLYDSIHGLSSLFCRNRAKPLHKQVVTRLGTASFHELLAHEPLRDRRQSHCVCLSRAPHEIWRTCHCRTSLKTITEPLPVARVVFERVKVQTRRRAQFSASHMMVKS